MSIALLIAFGFFIGSTLLVMGLNALTLWPWRKARDGHWTERARLLYPARQASILHVLMVPALCAVCWSFQHHPPLRWPAAAGCALAGSHLGTYFYVRTVFPAVTFRAWLSTIGVIYLVYFSSWVAVLAVGLAMPAEFNLRAGLLAVLAIGTQLAFIYGLGLKIGMFIGIIERAPERLARIVDDVASRIGIASPPCHVIHCYFANAAALVHLQRLLFTSHLLEICSDEEIASIAAHEIGHLTEPRNVIRARLLAALLLTPFIFIRPAIEQFGMPGFLVLVGVPFLGTIFLKRMARRMEVRADSIALEHSGPDSAVYARTLERLYQANQSPAVMPGSRHIHPHLYDRLLAAGLEPAYPRPKPPSRMRWTVFLLLVLAFSTAFLPDFFPDHKKQFTRLRHHRQLP